MEQLFLNIIYYNCQLNLLNCSKCDSALKITSVDQNHDCSVMGKAMSYSATIPYGHQSWMSQFQFTSMLMDLGKSRTCPKCVGSFTHFRGLEEVSCLLFWPGQVMKTMANQEMNHQMEESLSLCNSTIQ